MRFTIATLVPLAFLVACAGVRSSPVAPTHVAATPPDSFRDPARRTKIAGAVPKLDAHFADVAKKGDLPGLAVGLVVDGDLVWSKGYGVRDISTNAPVDADTVFRIGSITKTFTAIAALQLRDAGRLGLDDRASRWIPEMDDVVYPTSDSPPITLRALLTHSSGLPRIGNFNYADAKKAPTEEEIVASLRGLPLEYVPATRDEYSNLGVGLAGIAVGRAASMRYRDYVSAYILRPLGMTSSVWDREGVPADRLATAYARDEDSEKRPLQRKEHWRLGGIEGAGGLYSTVRDMGRWAALHLQAYPPRDEAEAWPVRRATLREAMSIHVADGMRVRSTQPVVASAGGVGYAWHAFQDCEIEDAVWHNGGTEGYSSAMVMLPKRGVALIALANVADAELDHPLLDAMHLLAKSGAIATREPAPSPALIDVRERVARLQDRWDEAEARALFMPEFIEGVGGMAKILEVRDTVAKDLGMCTHGGDDIRSESPTHGTWKTTCERGSVEYEAFVSPSTPARIGGMRFESLRHPGEALAKIGARVTALSEAWDEATFSELLSPAFEKDEMKRFFANVREGHGVCKLGPPLASDGASEAKWHLTCARSPLEMELKLDKGGRVASMLIVPPKRGIGDARCPK